ncbi:helix-turn-helix domain-containing protein [Capilliphycus salinus ALCB114379]|uniref:helix-turn-helix domain-containing protein n=1 Tax=Capilliphycus salinus TaxID=2768948 RepID=UPI0039A651BE
MEMICANMKENIPFLILTLRQRLGLSQEKLAAKLGVSFQTVNRWERGHTQPSQLALHAIKQKLIEMDEDGADLLDLYFQPESHKISDHNFNN